MAAGDKIKIYWVESTYSCDRRQLVTCLGDTGKALCQATTVKLYEMKSTWAQPWLFITTVTEPQFSAKFTLTGNKTNHPSILVNKKQGQGKELKVKSVTQTYENIMGWNLVEPAGTHSSSTHTSTYFFFIDCPRVPTYGCFSLSISHSTDTKVCVFQESCILPCTFPRGDDALIHWTTGNDVRVHSYYANQDQLSSQDPRFRSRTSMFKDEIAKGNAMLQLKQVEVQDEGQYKCYTSTITGNQETFIKLKVEGRVRKYTVTMVICV